jgi:glycosyltransferase involved in cell wall biosynthesis
VNKVLHIIENFNGQATERWLFEVMRHLVDLGVKVDWTFYSTLGHPGSMDDEVIALGGKIIYSPAPLKNKMQFVMHLHRSIYLGKYDVLHSHHDIVSAVYLLASIGLPLKKRIVHTHNTSLSIPTSSLLKQFLLREPMRRMCLWFADNIVGVSSAALDAFLNGGKPNAARDMVLHCGIDTTRFNRKSPNRLDFLKSLRLPIDSKIMLFSGRMIKYKNPLFVIEVLIHALKYDSRICAVFAGVGPLQVEVLALIKQKSLESRVRVLGWCENLPFIMQSSDILICPGQEEPKEGLGLVVVEAQAAGLPVIMSLGIPKEAIVVPELVEILPLTAGASLWADVALSIIKRILPSKEKALASVACSSFSIPVSAESIRKLYEI